MKVWCNIWYSFHNWCLVLFYCKVCQFSRWTKASFWWNPWCRTCWKTGSRFFTFIEEDTIAPADVLLLYEPRYYKINKMGIPPAKTQISLGIRPVWSECSLSAWRKLGSLATHWAQAKTLIRLGGCPGWSESSLGAQPFCWFWHVVAHIGNLQYFLICLA